MGPKFVITRDSIKYLKKTMFIVVHSQGQYFRNQKVEGSTLRDHKLGKIRKYTVFDSLQRLLMFSGSIRTKHIDLKTGSG